MLTRLAALLIVAAAETAIPVPKLKPLPNPVSENAKQSNPNQQNAGAGQNNSPAPVTAVQQRNSAERQPSVDPGTAYKDNGWFNGWSVGDKIALIIAIIAFLQFIALMFTYRAMDKTAKRQLRAYVSAIPEEMVLLRDKATIVAVIKIKNTGQTPAFSTQSLADMAVLEHPSKKPLRFNLVDEGKPVPTYVIFPRAQHVNAPKKILSEDEMLRLSDGKHALYAYGRVTYVDAFGNPQWTEFSAALDKPSFDDWLSQARAKLGEAIPAGFKFTATNNTASQDR